MKYMITLSIAYILTNLEDKTMSLGGSAKASKETKEENLDQIVTRTGTQTDFMEIDDEAVKKITDDLLSADGGLASIFAGEQSSGIFNSSVAALEAGDLSANIVGEIAKLRAKKVTKQDGFEETNVDKNSQTKNVSLEVNATPLG